jgi:hypothetical protein
MKTFCFRSMIAVLLLLCSNGILAQTTQTKLDQVELMKQLLGNWQANKGKDTILLFEYKQFGQAYLANTYHIIKGQKTLVWINNFGFDAKEGKFKVYSIFLDGSYQTLISSFITEKEISSDIVQDFAPETASAKVHILFVSSNEYIKSLIDKDGKKIWEYKFVKIKE